MYTGWILLGYVWEDDGYDLRVVVGLGNPRLLRSLLVMIFFQVAFSMNGFFIKFLLLISIFILEATSEFRVSSSLTASVAVDLSF